MYFKEFDLIKINLNLEEKHKDIPNNTNYVKSADLSSFHNYINMTFEIFYKTKKAKFKMLDCYSRVKPLHSITIGLSLYLF